jgi:hypothetical protein
MYPLAFKVSGLSYPELIDRLIRHALARASRASLDTKVGFLDAAPTEALSHGEGERAVLQR